MNGNLTKQANPDKTVTSKTYNYLDQVTEVNNYMSATTSNDVDYVLAKYSYTLNANGQKTNTDFYSNCDKTNNCASNIEVSTHDTYTYDALGRLRQAQRTIDNPTATIEKFAYTDIYTYDAVGNRTQLITSQSGAPVTIDYSYNGNNQLLTETTANGSWTYTYDDNGNRTAKANASTNEYVNNTWDRANNLTGVESALKNTEGTIENYKVNYTYDALGRRTSRTPDASVANESYNGITKQNYVYQGASWDMTSEYTDKTTGTDVHTNYLMANLGMGVPSLIASEDVQERTPNSDVNAWTKVADESSSELDPEHNFIVTPDSVQKFAYYQRDALDSIVSKTNLEVRYKGSDSTGTLVVNPTVNVINVYKVANQNRTDEYGKKLNDTATTPESSASDWSSRGYSGQVYDIESATYYYGSRNYDPANGTWTKLDTYRGETKNPLSRNRYAFVEEDPVNKIDKYGYASSKTNPLLQLLGWAVTHPKDVVKGLNMFVKDPRRTTTVAIVYVGTYYKTKGNTQKAKQAASRIMTNNSQYTKAYSAIVKVMGELAAKIEIDRKIQTELNASGIGVDCRYQSSPLCNSNSSDSRSSTFGNMTRAPNIVEDVKLPSNVNCNGQLNKYECRKTIGEGLRDFQPKLVLEEGKTDLPECVDKANCGATSYYNLAQREVDGRTYIYMDYWFYYKNNPWSISLFNKDIMKFGKFNHPNDLEHILYKFELVNGKLVPIKYWVSNHESSKQFGLTVRGKGYRGPNEYSTKSKYSEKKNCNALMQCTTVHYEVSSSNKGVVAFVAKGSNALNIYPDSIDFNIKTTPAINDNFNGYDKPNQLKSVNRYNMISIYDVDTNKLPNGKNNSMLDGGRVEWLTFRKNNPKDAYDPEKPWELVND